MSDPILSAPAPHSSGGFIETSIVVLFTGLWKLLMWILNILYFIALSILVIPSMLIMMKLHSKWEEKLKERFHIGY